MPLDTFARRFLELARATAEERSEAPSLADMRRTTEALAAFGAPERDRSVGTRDMKLGDGPSGIPIRVYVPASAAASASAGLIYFHGGGWVSGGLESHDPLCRALADEGRCRVIAVDYRLAPEHRFPAAIEDCLTAFELAIEQADRLSLDPERIGVGGDSAGANLAAVLCQTRRATKPAIALQLLLCPVLDALGRTASRSALAKNYFIEEAIMARYFEFYRIDGLEPEDPRASPARAANLADLPKTRIHTAEFDPLRDEAVLYGELLSQAGVDARVTVHPGMIHHFYGLSAIIPYARIGLAAIGADIREAFG